MRLIQALLLLLPLAQAQDQLPLTGISHVAFRVSDLDKARNFYTDVLGLPEAFTLGNTHFMKVNDDQYIEVQLGAPAEGNLRMTHIALVTTSVEKLHAMLIARGLEPAPLKPAGTDGNRSFRLNDPDGNILEFTEYQPGSLHTKARGKFTELDNGAAPRLSTTSNMAVFLSKTCTPPSPGITTNSASSASSRAAPPSPNFRSPTCACPDPAEITSSSSQNPASPSTPVSKSRTLRKLAR